MRLTRLIRIQLTIFTIVTIAAVGVMSFKYMKLPQLVASIGVYTVQVELPTTGGLYPRGNVTYRGVTVGTVTAIDLSDRGVVATMQLQNDQPIPADLRAEVHSRSAVGEQYVELLPQSSDGPMLADGDVIPVDRTSVPAPVGPLLDEFDSLLASIPKEDLNTVVNESYDAFTGAGPSLQRLIDSTKLFLGEAQANIGPTTDLVNDIEPFLDSQVQASDSIIGFSANLAELSTQAAQQDGTVRQLLAQSPALQEVQGLLQDIRPTLPVLLNSLIGVGEVAVTYNAGLEQTLVLLPQAAAILQTVTLPTLGGANDLRLSIELPANVPPICVAGFTPAGERRSPADTSLKVYPGDLYCKVAANSDLAVRGARNLPCAENPGVRAGTVALCREGGEDQAFTNPSIGKPQPLPVAAATTPQAASVAMVPYDPVTGQYTAPDGTVHVQSDLTGSTEEKKTWQTMLLPAR